MAPRGKGIKIALDYATAAKLTIVNTGHGNIQVPCQPPLPTHSQLWSSHEAWRKSVGVQRGGEAYTSLLLALLFILFVERYWQQRLAKLGIFPHRTGNCGK